MKNKGKVAIHFGTSVKNQVAQLDKRFKKAQKNLEITDSNLSNKDAIWPDDEV